MRVSFDLNWLYEDIFLHDDEHIKPRTFEERLEELRPIVFDFDYPIDDVYKDEFERAFLSHFWFYEIGFETFTRWHFELQAHLNVYGRRYNNMFKAQLEDIEEAINTMNIESTSEAEGDSKTRAEGGGDSESRSESGAVNRGSDVPQGRVDLDDNYISSLTDAKQYSESTGTTSETSSQDTEHTNKGRSTTRGYSGLSKIQLHRMWAEQMIVASEMVVYNMQHLFNHNVI